MTDRDTDIDELATGATMVDLPAIPRTDPPDRLSSGGPVRVSTREEDEAEGIRIPGHGQILTHQLEPMYAALRIAEETSKNVQELRKQMDQHMLVLEGLRSNTQHQASRLNDFASVLGALVIAGEGRPNGVTGLTVLIVEDNDLYREAVARELERSGATVSQAHSYRTALKYLDNGLRFDAALVDVRLDSVNGVEVARELRRRMPNCQIALITGGSLDHLQYLATEFGGTVLLKPCKLAAIKAALMPRAAE